MANQKIQVAELDFDQIKSNLKEFLKGQNTIQDYDFEGSTMSILLDVLAYNTHYNALYTNLAINESFLDSAVKRSSVVSLSKQLGYITKSALCSTAIVDITVNLSSQAVSPPITVTLPKYSPFTVNLNNVQYTFYTLQEYTAVLNNNRYVFNNIEIKEGTPLTFKYTVTQGQRYIVPNKDVDLSTLKVSVQASSMSSKYVIFKRSDTIINLDQDSAVYFVNEIDNELFEISFGDGVLGKAIEAGNIVHLEYLVTNKGAANNARSFQYQGSNLIANSTVSVVTMKSSTGGSEIEDIESIRYNAPRAYSTQNRGVTTEDYKSIILNNYPNVSSINVWGGENNKPVVYGKVFLCIKPKESLVLTIEEKNAIKRDILKAKNVISITPEIVDPKYTTIQVNSSVYFNSKSTNKTSDDIKAQVLTTIKDYNTNNLQKFDSIFRISNLMSLIDKSDQSIVSNITTIKLHTSVVPVYGIYGNYQIYLGNPIYYSGVAEESIKSGGFYTANSDQLHYLEDDGVGNVMMYTFSGKQKTVVNSKIGTIDYSTGLITIKNLFIDSLDPNTNIDELKFIIKPQSYDVASVLDQIISIPEELININVLVDTISMGNTGGGTNYIFSSSRS